MSLNLEIKARAGDLDKLEGLLRQRSKTPPTSITQEDVFFKVQKGRLKMRCENESECELIYYQRDNTKGPKYSRYFIEHIENPRAKKKELTRLFGIKTVVKKLRKLFLIDNARVHLDEVEGLGQFVEIEILLDASHSETMAQKMVERLMAMIEISEVDLIKASYEDLAIRSSQRRHTRQ